jgi:hypothetical protein
MDAVQLDLFAEDITAMHLLDLQAHEETIKREG